MKTLYKLMIVGVAVVFGLTGCFGVFSPVLGGTGDLAGETALIGATNAAESGSDPAGTPFDVAGVAGALSWLTGQTITITFDNGIVDIDATTNTIPGVTINELLAGPATDGEYDRSTVTAPYTATVDAIGSQSIATLTVDLSGATVSSPIEIAFDPATLTANGGARLFNQDSDDTPAEATDDAHFEYLAVGGGAPVAAAGDPWNPRDLVTFTPQSLAPIINDLALTVTGVDTTSTGFTANFTAASLSPGFSVFSYDPSTMTWTALTTTAGYAAGTLTLTLPAQVAAEDIFQIRFDRDMIRTGVNAGGYMQKATTDQNDSAGRYGRTSLLVESAASTAVLASLTVSAWNANPLYADVEFGGGGSGDIVLSTVTPDSVRFFYDDGTTVAQVPYNSIEVSGAPDNNTLRFNFAPTFTVSSGDSMEVLVYPTVRGDAGTPADPDDDFPVLDAAEPMFGISSGTDGF